MFFNNRALDQIFFCDPVVLKLICYRMRAYQLINESIMAGGLRKNWTGICTPRQFFFCNPVIYQLHITAIVWLLNKSNITRWLIFLLVFKKAVLDLTCKITIATCFLSLPVVLLSYDSRSTLIRLDCGIFLDRMLFKLTEVGINSCSCFQTLGTHPDFFYDPVVLESIC